MGLLLVNGADVNASDNSGRHTPLHRAANMYVAQALLTHNANVDARDSLHGTPLHYAAQGRIW